MPTCDRPARLLWQILRPSSVRLPRRLSLKIVTTLS